MQDEINELRSCIGCVVTTVAPCPNRAFSQVLNGIFFSYPASSSAMNTALRIFLVVAVKLPEALDIT
ncbi:hypothetical protein C9J03_03350 [Photobacterium gaetbulicola]|nr:hypothetical protein C9J03_03350 [Photobacterium gaetbulicola]